MSHISAGVEYGLHCLLYLARPDMGAAEASVRDLAEFQGVPTEFLAKLFTKLHRAGIVVAMEGVRGGFALARPAADISVLDVVLAIDGDKSIFDCREIRSRCALFEDEPPAWASSGVCAIHAVMQTAQKRMQEALASQSLADIAGRVAGKASMKHSAEVVQWFDQRATARRGASKKQGPLS